MVADQVVDERVGAVGVQPTALGDDGVQRPVDVAGHMGRVAANIEMRAVGQPPVQLVGVFQHPVPHVLLLHSVAGERQVQPGQRAGRGEFLQVLAVEVVGGTVPVTEEQPRRPGGPDGLTLGQALETAQQHQPQLWQARASAEAASARADELRAPILPQVTLTAGYQRTTANFVARPGAVPSSFNTSGSTSLDSFNFWSGGLTLNQYIWDFGVTTDRWRSSRAAAESLHQSSRAVEQQIIAGVRTAYFNARAQLALIQVARENLANLELHLKQIEGFAAAGTRPKIDLAQARADRAQGQVQLISAQNAYAVAKAQLNQAIGETGTTDYDVQDETLPPIPGEDGGTGNWLVRLSGLGWVTRLTEDSGEVGEPGGKEP